MIQEGYNFTDSTDINAYLQLRVNKFKRKDFSPQAVRMMMVRNLQSKVVPLVIYQQTNN